MLSDEEHRRYSRHTIMPEFGEQGQQKLKQAKVLMVGAGGLGCPAMQYLTAAGVGTIGIVDFDQVSESNLQRQILYDKSMIGQNKAEMAAQVLKRQNPFVNFVVYNMRLNEKNVLPILADYDLVIDGTDNFSTRYMMNDACLLLKKPLCFGSLYKFEGQVSVFNLTENSPSYRCLFPEPPDGDTLNCAEAGIIGVLPGIIGNMQALEAIKIITGIGKPLDGTLVCYNSLSQDWLKIAVARDSKSLDALAITKEKFEQTDYAQYERSCALPEMETITAEALLRDASRYRIVDIRELHERPAMAIDHVEKIPLSTIEPATFVLDERPTVIACQGGVRSSKFIGQLLSLPSTQTRLIDLQGGVNAVAAKQTATTFKNSGLGFNLA